VSNSWAELEFEVQVYKEQKDVYKLGAVDDVTANLDDSLVSINTILGSRYVGAIRSTVDEWQRKLLLFSDTLDEWLTCQKNWMYLETIFSAPDIQRQLPNESKMFLAVDGSWKEIMKRTNDNAVCIKIGTTPGLCDTFLKHNESLDKVQKSLEDYLETKRMAFPRFYFLSNDELLEILAQTKDPQAVQPHLRKCFDCLIKLDFGNAPGSVDILAMMSGEGERVALGKNLKARGNVEDWLTIVQENMQKSLHKFMKNTLDDYDERPRKEWVMHGHPGQCVASVAQMQWARGCEKCLVEADSNSTLKTWFTLNVDQLTGLTELVRGKLTRLERKVIVALVTTDVHARDIVEILIKTNVDKITNFTWQQQLRYYWDTDVDDVLVHQSNCSIHYGYEYMGAASRLVITPLTDRCWMTITGSFDLKLGAAPAGPAGTGKTESSKDLAKALAIQCIVFNCSDQIDYKMMGKLFSGLAQCGVWTCLDEFNRIDIEVLSVVAQQLTVLRQGRLNGQEDLVFEGRTILLTDHHVIVTMNPGYAGRTELPDNLKVCFRPVSMMVPDYGLIAEIMLFAEGFGDAQPLSRKMTKLYKLSSEQLSQQPHYDFGMRAVKSVLVMAGALKRSEPDLGEDIVLIRAMRDANVPKFLSDDLPLFFAIIQDLFPGKEVPVNDYGAFKEQMLIEIDKMGLQRVPGFITKILQLYETLNVRFGVVQVGPTGGGKTSVYRVLQNTLTSLKEQGDTSRPYFRKIDTDVLNPKCITMGELYGEFNELTLEWTDGLASTIMRRHVADESEDRKWTVWDGPIDALWIENMNTVLDDNMTLCLANGERIKLREEMNMVFEVMDLAVASPATVSRLGVVYLTPGDLGWMPYVQSWMPKGMADVSEELRKRTLDLFDLVMKSSIKFSRRHCKEPVPTVDINLATSCCYLLQIFYAKDAAHNMSALPVEQQVKVGDKIFIFCVIWSAGVSIRDVDLLEFDSFLRGELSDLNINIGLPSSGSVYDYFVDTETKEFTKWDSIVPGFEFDMEQSYFEMFVPSVDTVRYSYVTEQLFSANKPVFMTGLTGTGKTVMIQNLLIKLSPLPDEGGQGVVPVNMGFSAQTLSIVTQQNIEAKLEKKRKTLLGAPAGRKVILFVDDVNMPAVEEYGAQPPIELLRQFLDHGGFYDRQKLFWKDITDVILTVAAAPPGGGRNEVTPRFVRHFNVMNVPAASPASMTLVFNSILTGFLRKFTDDVKSTTAAVVKSTVEVFVRISAELLPTPSRFHYLFNLRDISKVFQGVLTIAPKSCRTRETMSKLWMHEAMRVFHDRLINIDDKRWFTELLCELISRNFALPWQHDDLFAEDSPIMMFGDFLKPGTDKDDKLYEEAPEGDKVMHLLEGYLEEYNASNSSQMNLVFFGDAIQHVSRIARILSQPRGNAMLVGVGGSGKQSLTRLAASMNAYECIQLEITRGYGVNEFHEDLKTLMIKAGLQGNDTVFLFTDTQIVVESFVEDINNVLNSGEVPNLFPGDEYDRILGDMREVVKKMGIPESRDNCEAQFVARVRDKLHIVLCMSPVGDALRVRCRQFPSLINCTTIDWFTKWPKQALETVATRFLSKLELPTEEMRSAMVEMCVEVHLSMDAKVTSFLSELSRYVYTTPKSYLDLISSYLKMLEEKRAELTKGQQRLQTGVDKLEESNALVANLKVELTELQPILIEKSKGAQAMLKQVAIDQKEAAVVKERVSKDEAEVGAQAAEVSAVAADAQKDLDLAMPALNNAVHALDALDKKDIQEIKSFTTPPDAVQMTMEAVCVLLEEKVDWATAKKVLQRSTFLADLKEFDKDNIPEPVLKKVAKYIGNPKFAVEVVGQVSTAAKSLCMWCHAMHVYSKIAKEVGPKKAKLQEMNDVLAAANAKLAEKQAELKAVVDKVAELQRQCDETVAEKQNLTDQAELTKNRLVRAGKLTIGLADEHVRWKATVERMTGDILALVGDVFLSAACISYYGAFTAPYRDELVRLWHEKLQDLEVDCSSVPSLVTVMGDPLKTRDWQIFGLPTDSLSTDNAILVSRGMRWPLMIDPQGQANTWIKNMESKANLQTTKLNDPNLLRSLEQCIRVGWPLLVEDIGETLDPSLEPILQKATYKQGGRILIRLGDSDVDYDPNFKFYLTTKLANPHYLPEVCIKVTIINFTVTTTGLEDQLLGDVVKKERPEVDKKRNDLIVSMAADKKQLKGIEDKILRLLSESEGNILDDEVLIDTLSESKITSGVISERLAESAITEKQIEETRNAYRSAATRGSIIYFVVADLALVDPMYQYSLEYFKRLFNQCIDDAEKSSDLSTRLKNLIEYQTTTIFINICRGLFEAHKMIFSFLICAQIMLDAGDIQLSEWMLLLKGCGIVERTTQPHNPDPERINPLQWDMLCTLDALRPAPMLEGEDEAAGTPAPKVDPPFQGLCAAMAKDVNPWLEWMEKDDAHKQPVPSPVRISMSSRTHNPHCISSHSLIRNSSRKT
jgi:dynein heavy chain